MVQASSTGMSGVRERMSIEWAEHLVVPLPGAVCAGSHQLQNLRGVVVLQTEGSSRPPAREFGLRIQQLTQLFRLLIFL